MIVLHGFSGHRLPELAAFVPWLQERHHVLQFDFRGHGESDAEHDHAGHARAARRGRGRALPRGPRAGTDRALRRQHGRRDRDRRRSRPAGGGGRRRCGLRRAPPPDREPHAGGRLSAAPSSARGRSSPAPSLRTRSWLADPLRAVGADRAAAAAADRAARGSAHQLAAEPAPVRGGGRAEGAVGGRGRGPRRGVRRRRRRRTGAACSTSWSATWATTTGTIGAWEHRMVQPV